MIFRRDQFERPYRDVAAQAVTARDLPIKLTETRIKIGTARYRSALAEPPDRQTRGSLLTSIIEGVGAR